MQTAAFSPQQSYYPSQSSYSFYYTPTGRYCAYDPISGSHFVHNLGDNRWYPYFPNAVPRSQQKQFHQYQGYHNVNSYQYTVPYDYQHHGTPRVNTGATRGYAEPDQGAGCERSGNREYKRREASREEEFLYSAAAARAAQRSLIEERDIGMDEIYEDVDMFPGEKGPRSRRTSHERQGQRMRSGPEVRDSGHHQHGQTYPRDSPCARISPSRRPQNQNYPYYQDVHMGTPRHATDNRPPRRYSRAYEQYGTNPASRMADDSENDSGYMDDFAPAAEPRRAMPGVARWLDDVGSVFSDPQQPIYCKKDQLDERGDDPLARNARQAHARDLNRDSPRDLYEDCHQSHDQHYQSPYYPVINGQYAEDIPAETEGWGRARDPSPPRGTRGSKPLHRQDSGIDMSGPIPPNADVQPDHEVNTAGNTQHRESHEEFDCYYVIPPCPIPPPPEEVPLQTVGQMTVYNSQDSMAPIQGDNIQGSPNYLTPDSIYSGSRQDSFSAHKSPAMLPRAPTPPNFSPPPSRIHQQARRCGFVPMEGIYDRRYRW